MVNNTLEIHQMNQFFQENQVYKNSETFTYESEVLGSINYNPLQETGYISIRLNKVFGDSIMKWAHLKSINQFKSALAGLALVGNLNDGSIVSFNINSDNSFLKTFYSKNGYTLSYKFDLSTSLRHHVHIVSNREGSSFSAIKTSQLTSSADLNNQLLIQNGVGSSIWVNFGDLKALFANKNNILITIPIFNKKF